LAGLIVVGADQERGVSADLLGMSGVEDGLGGRVGARPRDDRDPFAGGLHREGDDFAVFLLGQSGGFPSTATGNEPIDALGDLGLDQGL
jgi:hypothetical protein